MSEYCTRDERDVENLKFNVSDKNGKIVKIIEGDIKTKNSDGSIKWIFAMWNDFGMTTRDSDTGKLVPNSFDLFEKNSKETLT